MISQRSVQKYKDTDASPSTISQELDIDYLLTGTVAKQKDSVRIIVNLLNAPKDALLISLVFDEEFEHMLSVQSDIGTEVSRELNISLSPIELSKVRTIPTDNIEAYDLYLKGSMTSSTFLTEDLNRAIEYFQRSIDLDPDFALPYAGMAECYRILTLKSQDDRDHEIKKIKELALKSIEIDDNSLAHLVLGALALTKECNWEVAEKEYRRAIEVNPNNPDAHIYLADFLLHVKRSYHESEMQLKKAQLLDPFNLWHKLFLTKFYFFQRDYDSAMKEFREASRINEHVARTQEIGFFVLVKQEKYDEAMIELETLMSWNDKVQSFGRRGLCDISSWRNGRGLQVSHP